MSLSWSLCPIPGLFWSKNPVHNDSRGSFAKVFAGLPDGQPPFRLDEIYWSQSAVSVVRGLHCQIPPFHGRKIVFVTQGEVRDFVLDLRVGSPAYGRVHYETLSTESGCLLIPAGCAHGFEVLNGPATMTYAQEGLYDPSSDTGIRIDSTEITLDTAKPVVSIRDASLPKFADFVNPFKYSELMNE